MGLELSRNDSLQFRLEPLMPIEGNAYSWQEGSLRVTLSDPAGNRHVIQVAPDSGTGIYRPFRLPDSSAYQAEDWSLVAEVKDESGMILSDTLKPCCRFGLN